MLKRGRIILCVVFGFSRNIILAHHLLMTPQIIAFSIFPPLIPFPLTLRIKLWVTDEYPRAIGERKGNWNLA